MSADIDSLVYASPEGRGFIAFFETMKPWGVSQLERKHSEFMTMCAHAEHLESCPLCDNRTVFTKAQVAFLEDLLINACCMNALEKEKQSANLCEFEM